MSASYTILLRKTPYIIVFIAILLAQEASAQSFEPSVKLSFDLAMVNPSGDNVTTDVGTGGVSVDFDPKAGAGLRLEYRFSESLGLEFGFLGASSFEVNVGDLGDSFGVESSVSSFAPLTVGLNYHFDSSERFDLYAGPLLAFVRYGDVSVQTGTGGVQTIDSVDSDTGFGLILGVDVPLGQSNWLLQSNLRYIATELTGSTADGSFDSDFDPLILSIGFGYRF